MKPFIYTLLLVLLTTSCSTLKTIAQADHHRQYGGGTHWLVVRMTGPFLELVAETMFLNGNDGINQAALAGDEGFMQGGHIVTLRIRIYSPAEADQIICLLYRYPARIVNIEEICN